MFIDEPPIGVIEWDEDFQFIQLNVAAEEILGYSRADLVGESWREMVSQFDHDPMAGQLTTIL